MSSWKKGDWSYDLVFLQLRVPGYDIMGCGEAKGKEDAQEKAAEMFCNLLVENGLVDKKELSGERVEQNSAITGTPSGGYFPQPRPPAPPHFVPPPPHQFQSNFNSNVSLLTVTRPVSFQPGHIGTVHPLPSHLLLWLFAPVPLLLAPPRFLTMEVSSFIPSPPSATSWCVCMCVVCDS